MCWACWSRLLRSICSCSGLWCSSFSTGNLWKAQNDNCCGLQFESTYNFSPCFTSFSPNFYLSVFASALMGKTFRKDAPKLMEHLFSLGPEEATAFQHQLADKKYVPRRSSQEGRQNRIVRQSTSLSYLEFVFVLFRFSSSGKSLWRSATIAMSLLNPWSLTQSNRNRLAVRAIPQVWLSPHLALVEFFMLFLNILSGHVLKIVKEQFSVSHHSLLPSKLLFFRSPPSLISLLSLNASVCRTTIPPLFILLSSFSSIIRFSLCSSARFISCRHGSSCSHRGVSCFDWQALCSSWWAWYSFLYHCLPRHCGDRDSTKQISDRDNPRQRFYQTDICSCMIFQVLFGFVYLILLFSSFFFCSPVEWSGWAGLPFVAWGHHMGKPFCQISSIYLLCFGGGWTRVLRLGHLDSLCFLFLPVEIVECVFSHFY